MKKVWKYVIITLLMLLGLCCVGVLYLFFIPNSQLFNITYINNSKKIVSAEFDKETVSQINLNSRTYEVNILPSSDSSIYAEAKSHSFGFVLTKNETFEMSATLRDEVLTINITEPYGFAIHNDSKINLYLPTSKAFNLNLSNSKAKTNISSKDAKINNLTYSTQSGDFNFKQGEIKGEMNLNLDKSVFTMSSAVKTHSNNVILSLSKGRFYAEESILGNVNIIHNTRGIISINECGILEEDIASAGGQIYVNKMSHLNISTSDTNLTIGEITHGATITMTKSGNISINKLNENSSIYANSGNVTINNVEDVLTLETNSGNINVFEAKKEIRLNLNKGNANIHFSQSETAEGYDPSDPDNKNKRLIATISNGSLNATGVENVGLQTEGEGITITGSGSANVRMNNVLGNNSINSNNGNVNIVVNKDSQCQYVLLTQSTYGYVRVNLTQIPDYNGYKTKELTETAVNCSSSSNNLSVTTVSGNLIVLDTNFG